MKSLASLLQLVRSMHRGIPTAISFNVTHNCNLRCIMCNIHQTAITDMTLSEIERIMTDLKTAGFQVVEITGGEPFIRKDLFEIFDILEKLHFRYTLNTNGTLLTQENVTKLNRYPGIMQIAVSIDSFRKEVFAQIRGSDMLERVLDGLDTLLAHGPTKPLKVNLTLNRLNYREFSDFLAFCQAKGLYLSVFPVNMGSDFRHRYLDNSLIPSEQEKQEMSRLFEELGQLRKKGEPLWEHSSFYQGAATYVLHNQVVPCDAGRLFFDLHADGKLAVCNDLPPFGDLLQERFQDCLQRLPEQQQSIHNCYRTNPCYYTCTYAISAIAKHKISYIYESMKMMGLQRFFQNFLLRNSNQGKGSNN